MGFWDRIKRASPGSYENTTKVMFKSYINHKLKYPDKTLKELFLMILKERFAIFKFRITDRRIREIAEESEDIKDLIVWTIMEHYFTMEHYSGIPDFFEVDYKVRKKLGNCWKRFCERPAKAVVREVKNKMDRAIYDQEFKYDLLQVNSNKCEMFINHIHRVPNHLRTQYDYWLSEEVKGIFDKVNKNDLDSEELDSLILHLLLFSATVAYCAQFQLEDREIFYHIYNAALNLEGLDSLVTPSNL